MRIILRYIRIILAIILGVMFAIFLMAVFYRRPPIAVVRANVLTSDLELDHNFQGQWVVTIYDRDCVGSATRWLQSISRPDWQEPLSPISVDLRRMVTQTPKLIVYPITPFVVPETSPLGGMSYHNVSIFRCELVWPFFYNVEVIFPPVTFNVVDHKP